MGMKRKMTFASCFALVLCIALSGCGNRDGEKDNAILGLEPVPIGSEQKTETDAPEDASQSGEEASVPTDSYDSESENESSQTQASGEAESPASAPVISCEILRDALTDDAGEEIAFAEYPRFYVEGEGHEALSAALDTINEYWKAQGKTFLDEVEEDVKEYRASVDASGVFGQGTHGEVARCDAEVVCLTVARTVEVGGPHPNNYFDAYNLNAVTGQKLLLADVMTVDESLVETILAQLHEYYPEVEFDDEAVSSEISERLASGAVDWYFYENQISLGFPEGAFGYPHAVGSLGVLLSVE